MRAAAEIGEVALRVERDVALRRVDQLDLVRLSLGLEPRAGGVASDRLPRPRPALADLAHDLRLDRGEILLADRLRELEVVVEAVLDRGPDRDLHVRVQPAHGLGQEMRRGVAEDGERVGIVVVARRQDLERRPVAQRQPEVPGLAVDAREHGLLGELRPDRAGGIERARPVGKLERAPVGELHVHVAPG